MDAHLKEVTKRNIHKTQIFFNADETVEESHCIEDRYACVSGWSNE